MTLIGQAVVDIKFWPIGLPNLRCLSLLNPVSLDPISYSLSELLLDELLTFHGLFLAFLNSLEHGSHVSQPFLAPILLVRLMFLGWPSSELSKGLTILIPTMTLSRVMSLMGPTVSLAMLAKLLHSCLLWDSIR